MKYVAACHAADHSLRDYFDLNARYISEIVSNILEQQRV